MRFLRRWRWLCALPLLCVLWFPSAGFSVVTASACDALELNRFCVLALTNGELQDVAFSPDGTKVAFVGQFFRATVLNVPDGTPYKTSSSNNEFGRAVAFSPDGGTLAVGGERGVSLWNLATDGRTFIRINDAVSALAFAPSGARVALGLEDGTLHLGDGRTGEIVASAVDNEARFGSAIVGVAVSPDGSRVASNSVGGARLWDAADLSPVRTLVPDLLHPLGDIAFSPDGRYLAHGDKVPSVPLWRLEDGKAELVRRFPTLANGDLGASSAAFSPDGRHIAVGAFDYEQGTPAVRLWDVNTGRQEVELFGLGRATEHVAYGGAGAYVAAASNSLSDGTLNHLLLWRVR